MKSIKLMTTFLLSACVLFEASAFARDGRFRPEPGRGSDHGRYEWVNAGVDTNGCDSCSYCNLDKPCDKYNVGETMGCRVAGTANNDQKWRCAKLTSSHRPGRLGTRYKWTYSYTDNNDCSSCRSCTTDCNRYTSGVKKACRQPGTKNNNDVYICRQIEY